MMIANLMLSEENKVFVSDCKVMTAKLCLTNNVTSTENNFWWPISLFCEGNSSIPTIQLMSLLVPDLAQLRSLHVLQQVHSIIGTPFSSGILQWQCTSMSSLFPGPVFLAAECGNGACICIQV